MRELRNLKAVLLVIIAAFVLEATALVQMYYSQKGLIQEASLRAESELEASHNEIMDYLNQTEAAVRNSMWIAQWCLNVPDSLHRVCQRIVSENPVVVGSTVALVPGYLKSRPLFSPYVCLDDEGNLKYLTLATEEYDYPSQEWFREPVARDEGYWSEPYVDEGGGEILMTTYSMPVHDTKGKIAAVLTADISLEWLKETVGRIDVYPHAYCTVYSRSGHVMVSPPEKIDTGKQKLYEFSTKVERADCTLTLVIPSRDIFGVMRHVGTIVLILQILGLGMIILMLHSYIKGELRYQELDKKRARMAGELQVATGIQMSMVPKTFPPFPERHDLDMFATIIPAKEVGGDLYDFFIRDEKLFFCIGDVSGKGVPASLVMAVTRTTFRNLSSTENSPGRIVRAMNDNLSVMNENNMFVTFFCGVLDMKTGHLLYCNAGHNAPVLLNTTKSLLPVVSNIPLGIMEGADFKEQETDLYYDDALFLYTDGLTEAENAAHELFGEERMMEVFSGLKGSRDHLEKMRKSVSAFVGEAPQSDDLTMLIIHYLNKHLLLHNDIQQIPRLARFVEAIASEKKLDSAVTMNLNLALEEAVTNVIMYAYPEGTDGLVDIEAIIGEKQLEIIISDSGMAFDPTARPDVDISLDAEKRPVGGLGIHLVRSLMDSVKYERKDGKNVLSLIKNI